MVKKRSDSNSPQRSRMKMDLERYESIDPELEAETRMVLLNFMSLIPMDITPGLSLHSSGSSDGRHRRSLEQQHSVEGARSDSRAESFSLARTLPTLPEASYLEKVLHHDESGDELGTPEEKLDLGQFDGNYDLEGDGLDHADEPDALVRTNRPPPIQFKRSSLAKQRTLSDSDSTKGKLLTFGGSTERQISNVSSSSEGTEASDVSSMVMSTRSGGSTVSASLMSIPSSEVDGMVQRGVLPPGYLPLQQQLNQEMDKLQKQRSVKAKTPSPSPSPVTPILSAVNTPQTEVAFQLGVIGDMVQAEYGRNVDKAFKDLLSVPKEQLSYGVVQAILVELIQHIPGISQQIAVVMLICKKLVVFGQDLNLFATYTVRFLMDRWASYILMNGGWSSINSLMCSPESPDTPALPSNPDMTDGPTTVHPSTSSATLVQEDLEPITDDSGYLPGSHSAPDSLNLARDLTLDSISSIPIDITPSEAPAQPPNGAAAKCEETESANVRKQSQVLRQVSKTVEENVKAERKQERLIQTVSLWILGSALAATAAFYVYRSITRK